MTEIKPPSPKRFGGFLLLFCIWLYLQIISWKFDLWYNGIVQKNIVLKKVSIVKEEEYVTREAVIYCDKRTLIMKLRQNRESKKSEKKYRKEVFYGIVGILLISLIVLYTVLNSMENKRTLQVKNEIYTFEMTEEEAAKAVFDYIYSDCDYDAKVISTMLQGQMVYLYQTQEKSDLQYEMLQSKDRTEDGQYYVFAHDTRYETDALSQGFYYEYHTDYAVNRETGEVLQESQWIETDAGYKLLYSEAYEKAVNQLYFNEDISDGKMSGEQAARVLFYYMYSDEGVDYDSIVVRTYKQEQSVYVFQLPEDQEFPCVRNFSCKGMTEDKEYYIFADYTDYYTHGYEPVFTHYQYLTNYAVNRETGEVLREREWSDIECEWLYNEEYKKAVK